METLKITSCMAANADPFSRDVSRYIAQRLQLPTAFVDHVPWQERERLLDAGEVDVCWICGLPYVWKANLPDSHIALLVAPVMSGERYQGRPAYFSDVVVHHESPFRTFADLRGASWAYNEPGSHSGYNVVRYHLATLGETAGYFGRVVASGAHQVSLRMILERRIDASAIDSTVLETELRRDSQILSQIRVIDSLGPSPMPPWVASTSLSKELRSTLRDLLLNMHTDPQGRAILEAGQIARFTVVTDRDYDPIRQMAELAQHVTL